MKNNRKNVIIGIFVTTTILLGCTLAYFVVTLQNTKQENTTQAEKITEYETKVSNLNSEVSKYKAQNLTLQNQVKSQENTIKQETTKTVEISQENINKIAQSTIRNYLNFNQEMYNATGSIDLVLKSTYLGFYSSNEDLKKHYTEIKAGVYKTDIKYEDFISKVTKYVTRELFEKSEYFGNYKNVDGFLTLYSAGASGGHFDVDSVEFISKSNNEYSYKVKYNSYPLGDSSGFNSLEGNFTVKNMNNNYVVSKADK